MQTSGQIPKTIPLAAVRTALMAAQVRRLANPAGGRLVGRFAAYSNHRGHTTLRTLLAVTAAATALAWLGPVALDGQPLDWAQDDHQAEWLQAQDLADAQASARAAWERSERDAARCRRLHGESALVYTADDMPVCVPRRAVQPRGTHLASSAEAQP